jgi:hypothetical protein
VNIDVGGLGAGIYDRLVEQGYGGSFGSGKLNAVNFGSSRSIRRRWTIAASHQVVRPTVVPRCGAI